MARGVDNLLSWGFLLSPAEAASRKCFQPAPSVRCIYACTDSYFGIISHLFIRTSNLFTWIRRERFTNPGHWLQCQTPLLYLSQSVTQSVSKLSTVLRTNCGACCIVMVLAVLIDSLGQATAAECQ